MQRKDLNNPLWTALITPLTSSGQPDLTGLEGLIREQEKAGNGILILGSTGEALNLGPEEKRLVVEFTTALDPAIPVMAGVGGHHLPDVISWLCFLETCRIDAYLMVTPLYAKPGSEGQYHWFVTLMDFVSRPVMLYNIPGRAGSALHIDTVERLQDHRKFWAIKEASGSVSDFREYKRASGSSHVYSGDDIMLPDIAAYGAAGVVSVAGNLWPQATRLYSRMALEGTLTSEDRILWKSAAGSLFVASNPVPTKAVLAYEGRIRTPEVKPPLHRDDMTSLDMVCTFSRQIREWYQSQTGEREQESITSLENAQ